MSSAPLQNLPPSTPRDGAKQLIDNNRVAVWDVTLEKGKPTAMHEHRYNMVGVNLTDATLKVVNRVGRVSTRISRKGELISAQKGSADSQEVTGTEPWHAIMIDLKDAVVPSLANNSGYPEAFPREGAKKLLDNARVTVWDHSWTPGKTLDHALSFEGCCGHLSGRWRLVVNHSGWQDGREYFDVWAGEVQRPRSHPQ
jgi:hypothetical protein